MGDFYDKEVGYNIDERDKGFNRAMSTASAQQGLAGVEGNFFNGLASTGQSYRSQALTEEQQGANLANADYARKLEDHQRRLSYTMQKLGITQAEAERLIGRGGLLYNREDAQEQQNIAREDAINASKAAGTRSALDAGFKLGGAAIGGVLASPAGPAGVTGGATLGTQIGGALSSAIMGATQNSQSPKGVVSSTEPVPYVHAAPPNVTKAIPAGGVVGPTGKISMGPPQAIPVARKPMLTPAPPTVYGPVDNRRKQVGRPMGR